MEAAPWTVNEMNGQDAPVQMTVHELGAARTAGQGKAPDAWGRLKAMLVLLVCASPVIAST